MRGFHIGEMAAAALVPAVAASARRVSQSGSAMDRMPNLNCAADRHECGGMCTVDIKEFHALNAGGPCPAPLEQILSEQRLRDRYYHAFAVAILCPQFSEQSRRRRDRRHQSKADSLQCDKGHANEGANAAKRA
jgi:hypothetical protein